jgi:hypothetical protein
MRSLRCASNKVTDSSLAQGFNNWPQLCVLSCDERTFEWSGPSSKCYHLCKRIVRQSDTNQDIAQLHKIKIYILTEAYVAASLRRTQNRHTCNLFRFVWCGTVLFRHVKNWSFRVVTIMWSAVPVANEPEDRPIKIDLFIIQYGLFHVEHMLFKMLHSSFEMVMGVWNYLASISIKLPGNAN